MNMEFKHKFDVKIVCGVGKRYFEIRANRKSSFDCLWRNGFGSWVQENKKVDRVGSGEM